MRLVTNKRGLTYMVRAVSKRDGSILSKEEMFHYLGFKKKKTRGIVYFTMWQAISTFNDLKKKKSFWKHYGK